MRGSTVVLAIIAVIAVGALLFTWGGDSSDRSNSRLGPGTGVTRSGDAQDRLSNLRDAYDRRDSASDRDALEKQANRQPQVPRQPRRELPTRGVEVDRGMGTDEVLDWDEDDAEEVVELRDVILNDPDPDERIGGILMLTGNEHPDAVGVLVNAMDDGNAEVRLAAVEALADYVEVLEPNALSPALDDPDPEVRFEAVSVLGDFENDAAFGLVRQALDDPDEDVRELAVGIIEDLEEEMQDR